MTIFINNTYNQFAALYRFTCIASAPKRCPWILDIAGAESNIYKKIVENNNNNKIIYLMTCSSNYSNDGNDNR